MWCAAVTDDNKRPLIQTDASNGAGFRYFMHNSMGIPRGRSVVSTINKSSATETLSFQTVKFLRKWGNETNILLVGGKNHVYMLDGVLRDAEPTMSYRKLLVWRTKAHPIKNCAMVPGRNRELCGNYIRFIELTENNELMVCGTNTYFPSCRFYTVDQFQNTDNGSDSDYVREEKCSSQQCVVPKIPTTSSASLYTNTENGYQVFTASIPDVTSTPVIMRKNRTLLSNLLWLNEPTFLKLVEFEDKIYIFFREIAKKWESGTDEKVTYARVARVCKDDVGGVNVLANQWTTFIKARLMCNYSERDNILFNNLTSVSDIVSIPGEPSSRTNNVVFATFTTPQDWKDASLSAVCAYSMRDIADVFEHGRFLHDYKVTVTPVSGSTEMNIPVEVDERSYAVDPADVPSPRPGRCGSILSPNALYFAKAHPLLYDTVMPKFSRPLYVTYNLRATKITVDSNAGDSKRVMIYVGSEDGRVLRLRNTRIKTEDWKLELVESITAADENHCRMHDCSIRSLHVSRPDIGSDLRPSLFVAFADHMMQKPLARCSGYRSKECCSVDPDCGWYSMMEECVERRHSNSRFLSTILEDTEPTPKRCKTIGNNECGCAGRNEIGCHNGPDDYIDAPNLENPQRRTGFDLKDILRTAVSNGLHKQFRDTVSSLGSEQIGALKEQLEEAVASTIRLVLENHKQEYCLPSPAVNHLVHVYPLLLREIELWHATALKKMIETGFNDKCWTGQKKCPTRVSFSLPLVPVLWQPLKKLIENFNGHCRYIQNPRMSASYRPHQKVHCVPLPGLETCKNHHQPNCKAMECMFNGYAVDAKAFFRHVNDTRYLYKQNDQFDPLWKPVNATVGGRTIRGHLELVVSNDMPFSIGYSPVAEKVKIMFHYKPVKDCDLSDPTCVRALHGCDPEVEQLVDHWFKKSFAKLNNRLRKCRKEQTKAIREHKKSAKKQKHLVRRAPTASTEWEKSNVIASQPVKCKYVTLGMPDLPDHRMTDRLWSLIRSRGQKAGGLYEVPRKRLRFSELGRVLQFFRNECSSSKPTDERLTFIRTVRANSHSRAEVRLKPLVANEMPFVIMRNKEKIVFKFFFSRDSH